MWAYRCMQSFPSSWSKTRLLWVLISTQHTSTLETFIGLKNTFQNGGMLQLTRIQSLSSILIVAKCCNPSASVRVIVSAATWRTAKPVHCWHSCSTILTWSFARKAQIGTIRKHGSGPSMWLNISNRGMEWGMGVTADRYTSCSLLFRKARKEKIYNPSVKRKFMSSRISVKLLYIA